MATVKELQTIVDQLNERVAKLESDNEKILGMLQAAVDECRSLQSRLAAASAKQGSQPKNSGAKEETFASVKDALAAAKTLATSGKAKGVKVNGCVVSYYPVA